MNCPKCTHEMKPVHYPPVDVMSCRKCKGLWVSRTDLEKMKSAEDEYLSWMELDLWKKHTDSEMVLSERMCPECEKNMYVLKYPETDIEIDICDTCQSVWLDTGELTKLIAYLKDRTTNETAGEYLKDVGHELVELFAGKEEINHFFKVLKLLEYRIFAEFPVISKLISKVPPA